MDKQQYNTTAQGAQGASPLPVRVTVHTRKALGVFGAAKTLTSVEFDGRRYDMKPGTTLDQVLAWLEKYQYRNITAGKHLDGQDWHVNQVDETEYGLADFMRVGAGLDAAAWERRQRIRTVLYAPGVVELYYGAEYLGAVAPQYAEERVRNFVETGERPAVAVIPWWN